MKLKDIIYLPKKVSILLKRKSFINAFKSFDPTSAAGLRGYGDGCDITGKNRISIGKNTWIGKGAEIAAYENHFSQALESEITIGDNVRIHENCRITCAKKITIENQVLFAPDVFVTDHNHGMDPTLDSGYSPQPLVLGEVKICNGCWLGQRVCVLPGVTIGERCIIGANSVVTKDIPPYSIAAGSPAKVIKTWNFDKGEWTRV